MSPVMFLRRALEVGALRFETIKTRGRRISPYYFNTAGFNTAALIMELSVWYGSINIPLLVEKKMPIPQVIFGPAYKGIPLSIAFAIHLNNAYFPCREKIQYSFNRKEIKRHGDRGDIVGASVKDKLVLILDDALSTGESTCGAVETVIRGGGTPIGCIVALDRMERGRRSQRLAAEILTARYGIPLFSIATLNHLITLLTERPELPLAKETLPKILAYREMYGVAS